MEGCGAVDNQDAELMFKEVKIKQNLVEFHAEATARNVLDLPVSNQLSSLIFQKKKFNVFF